MVARIFRIAFALVILVAIGIQFASVRGNAGFDATNFFSFFTIVCNLFGAGVSIAVAFDAPRDEHARDVLRGAAVLCLAIVGVVFSLLLADLKSSVIPWIDTIVHVVSPVAIVADWCLDPPRTRLTMRDVPAWLVLPAAYAFYTLARGALVHWYPYPFLDVATIGYQKVGAYLVAIAAFTIVAALLLLAIANALRARRM